MKIRLVENGETGAYRPVDSFSYARLSEIGSLDEVLAFVSRSRAANPEARFLCTLDDLNQCCYTSMHAAGNDRIEWPAESVDFDDPRAVHAFEVARLEHVVARLDDARYRTTWEAVAGTLRPSPADIAALVATNRDASAVLDDVVYVQRLPVSRDDLLLAGLPNGYFSSDWDVFQNHAVIRRMEELHGYRFFGIGASWLGFVADAPPNAQGAARLIEDLTGLYGHAGDASDAWRELESLARRSPTLLLCYTEDFA
ncbi:hypothetical protein C5N14_21170 [Micromonospora sp. MW-13]|uniref:hypothetical protein n=1 Tax=Micromonospora sp. MW-13 TaxID=2094022 RepID=UPI000E436CBD|nr:hypothetical protein [Micromonospora sp. MW-13]RGC66969.1 hypothetical protein C5N14_21170 [Micromonospora sp. MW-13]